VRHELEAESESGGDYLAQVADLKIHLRDLPTAGVAAGDLDHRLGDGERVQAR
jgi:hypothetical protein